MVAQLWEYTENCLIVYFKWVNCMVYDLYLNKAAKETKEGRKTPKSSGSSMYVLIKCKNSWQLLFTEPVKVAYLSLPFPFGTHVTSPAVSHRSFNSSFWLKKGFTSFSFHILNFTLLCLFLFKFKALVAPLRPSLDSLICQDSAWKSSGFASLLRDFPVRA